MNTQPQKSTGAFACPKTLCGTLSCVIICATIAFIACLVISPRSGPSRRLWIPVVIETNGNETVLGETRQMEFWTPSVKTKDYLAKHAGEVSDREKWEIIQSDEAVIQFGIILHTNDNVFGYRRVEEWGQGRTGYKPGWWWTMNVATNFTAGELAHTYREYWKSTQPMLIEVIDNRGSGDK